MNIWLFRTLWISAILAIAGIITWLFDVNFFLVAGLLAASLILNGLLAEWEDRRPGGFLNPRDMTDE